MDQQKIMQVVSGTGKWVAWVISGLSIIHVLKRYNEEKIQKKIDDWLAFCEQMTFCVFERSTRLDSYTCHSLKGTQQLAYFLKIRNEINQEVVASNMLQVHMLNYDLNKLASAVSFLSALRDKVEYKESQIQHLLIHEGVITDFIHHAHKVEEKINNGLSELSVDQLDSKSMGYWKTLAFHGYRLFDYRDTHGTFETALAYPYQPSVYPLPELSCSENSEAAAVANLQNQLITYLRVNGFEQKN